MANRVTYTVTGVEEAQARLRRAVVGLNGNVGAGLSAAGILIRNESLKLAPVDQGILRNSAFSKLTRLKNSSYVTVGFTAKYAAAVHYKKMVNKGKPREGKDAKGAYWDGGENLFLMKGLVRNISRVISVMTKYGRKPLL
jgi:hypothetical protein